MPPPSHYDDFFASTPLSRLRQLRAAFTPPPTLRHFHVYFLRRDDDAATARRIFFLFAYFIAPL